MNAHDRKIIREVSRELTLGMRSHDAKILLAASAKLEKVKKNDN